MVRTLQGSTEEVTQRLSNAYETVARQGLAQIRGAKLELASLDPPDPRNTSVRVTET